MLTSLLLIVLFVFFLVAGIVWSPVMLAILLLVFQLIFAALRFICVDGPLYFLKIRYQERIGREAIAAQDETQWGKTPWWESGRK